MNNAVGVWTASAGAAASGWGFTGSAAVAAVCGGLSAVVGAVLLLIDVKVDG